MVPPSNRQLAQECVDGFQGAVRKNAALSCGEVAIFIILGWLMGAFQGIKRWCA